MSIFGHDYKGRKNLPIFHFLTRYFPKALVEVTRVCVAGNAQHNKDLELFDINWSRGKSTDQLNTAMRHMMDHAISGPLDEEPPEVLAALGLAEGESTYHLAKAAWRILAALELQIEEDQERKVKYEKVPSVSMKYNLGKGHTWAGVDGSTRCPKCACIHNLSFSDYTPESFEPEPNYVDRLPIDPRHD